MKQLKHAEGKNEQQLEAIRDQGDRQLEAIKDFSAPSKQKEIKFGDEESQESKILRYQIKKLYKEDRIKIFVIVHSNRTLYDFNKFRDPNNFVLDIFNADTSIKYAKTSKVNWQIK